MGIFVLILLSIVLSTIISGASYIVSIKQPDGEKVSVYECGFDPFGSSRVPFSVKFFLVGILCFDFDRTHTLCMYNVTYIYIYNTDECTLFSKII